MDKNREGSSVIWFGCCADYGNRFVLSKAHNWKSPGSDEIQNYWPKAFPADQRHIAKKALM
jgi:hypothetical protein